MKLKVNYDLIERVRDSQDELRVRLIRKNFKQATNFLPSWFLFGTILFRQADKGLSSAVTTAAIYFSVSITAEILASRIAGDFEKEKAINDLKELSALLSDLNVKTSYELLLESQEDERKYSVKLNESKIQYLLQEKYITVPTYNDGEIKDISLLQEHIMGSKEYVLSVGSPTKVRKLVLVKTH